MTLGFPDGYPLKQKKYWCIEGNASKDVVWGSCPVKEAMVRRRYPRIRYHHTVERPGHQLQELYLAEVSASAPIENGVSGAHCQFYRNYMIDPDVRSDAVCFYTFERLMERTVPYCMQADFETYNKRTGMTYEHRDKWFIDDRYAFSLLQRIGCLN